MEGEEHEGGKTKRGRHASFMECDVNVSLIKSEAVPIIHTLLQRLLSPHALLHLGGSAGGSDYGPISTAERRGAPGSQPPAIRLRQRPSGPFPTVCGVAVAIGVTGGVTVDECWGAEKPRDPCSS